MWVLFNTNIIINTNSSSSSNYHCSSSSSSSRRDLDQRGGGWRTRGISRGSRWIRVLIWVETNWWGNLIRVLVLSQITKIFRMIPPFLMRASLISYPTILFSSPMISIQVVYPLNTSSSNNPLISIIIYFIRNRLLLVFRIYIPIIIIINTSSIISSSSRCCRHSCSRDRLVKCSSSNPKWITCSKGRGRDHLGSIQRVQVMWGVSFHHSIQMVLRESQLIISKDSLWIAE
jgi:hypothetical protein